MPRGQTRMIHRLHPSWSGEVSSQRPFLGVGATGSFAYSFHLHLCTSVLTADNNPDVAVVCSLLPQSSLAFRPNVARANARRFDSACNNGAPVKTGSEGRPKNESQPPAVHALSRSCGKSFAEITGHRPTNVRNVSTRQRLMGVQVSEFTPRFPQDRQRFDCWLIIDKITNESVHVTAFVATVSLSRSATLSHDMESIELNPVLWWWWWPFLSHESQ
jgi:hypothetical protein